MSLSRILGTTILLVAIAAPAFAQTAQSPAQQNAIPARYRGLWMRAVHQLDLTSTQQQQIEAAIDKFRQAHPPGSAPDPSARRALREQVMQVLTPAQRQQVQAYIQQMRTPQGAAGGAAPAATPSP
jgi:Spy/CpxP family protein refolding chaperone